MVAYDRRVSRRSPSSEEPQDLVSSTGFLLARIGSESRRRWTQSLAALGLRPSHYGVLMVLAGVESASQKRLGEIIGVDPRNVVGIIDVLEERGLVERGPHPSDRRRHGVRLTAAGRETLRQFQQTGTALEQELLAALDESERTVLQELLLRLLPAVAGKPFEVE
jgi:DNA-binding MarR family transcriptional regulator